ncbi:MAG TPA: hypothetical protein VEM40_00120 [Nitrospirota bacterium]|nr:hypothetical protein [Nitrospirota bacterium]
MLVKQDVLEQAVLQEAHKAHADFKRDGHVETQVLIYSRDMTESATVHVSQSIDNPGLFREILKKMVEQESPEAVLTIYQAEVPVNYEEVGSFTKSPGNPKRKMIIRIEASSPVANYELVLVYRKLEDWYIFEHDVCVPVERGGCAHTRDLWGSVN